MRNLKLQATQNDQPTKLTSLKPFQVIRKATCVLRWYFLFVHGHWYFLFVVHGHRHFILVNWRWYAFFAFRKFFLLRGFTLLPRYFDVGLVLVKHWVREGLAENWGTISCPQLKHLGRQLPVIA